MRRALCRRYDFNLKAQKTCVEKRKTKLKKTQVTDSQSVCIHPQVAGERYVYKFVCEPEALISLAFPDNQRPNLKAEFERYINEEDTVPLSHLDEHAHNMGPQSYSKGYMY